MKINESELIILMPVYEDLDSLSHLLRDLVKSLNKNIYIVLVDDGSIEEVVQRNILEVNDLHGTIISLSRNIGHQKAIAVGLNFIADNMSEHQHLIVMDSDGEDTPESIEKILLTLNNDNLDLVAASRKSRVESIKFKFFYKVYKSVYTILSGKKIDFGNYMGLKYIAVKRLVRMKELNLHLASTVVLSRLRYKTLPIDRGKRYSGKSKMNFSSLVLHGFKGLMVHAEDVFVRIGIFSTLIAVSILVITVLIIFMKIFSFTSPGWASLVLGVMLIVFIQTATLTLMMLMITGILKSQSFDRRIYKSYIDTTELI